MLSLAASIAAELSEMEAGQMEEEPSEKDSQQGGRVGRESGGAEKQGPCNEQRADKGLRTGDGWECVTCP